MSITIRWMQRSVIASIYLLFCFAIAAPAPVHAHGGVVLEDDLCVINVGFYQAHFTIFQPLNTRHEQFCEDLPGTGESIFVLEYLHDGLDQLPVDFRIIRNTTGMGLFAGVGDVEKLGDLTGITEFYHPPVTEPDAFAVLHPFEEPGAFIGIVSAVHPETNVLYTAVFPFEVGAFGLNYPLIAIAVVMLLLAAMFVSTRWRAAQVSSAALLLLVLLPITADAQSNEAPRVEALSRDGYFTVTAVSRMTPLTINRIHTWELTVTDRNRTPVEGAELAVDGGMPEHDHGLPTDPRVAASPAPGRYLVNGVKFHMRGAWEIYVSITVNGRADTATLALEL